MDESFYNIMDNKMDIKMTKEDIEPQQPDNKQQNDQPSRDPIPSPEITEYSCPCCYPPIIPGSSKYIEHQHQPRRSFPPPLPWHHNHYTTHHHNHHDGVSRWPFTSVAMPHGDPPPRSSTTLKDRYDVSASRSRGEGCYVQHPYHSSLGNFYFKYIFLKTISLSFYCFCIN